MQVTYGVFCTPIQLLCFPYLSYPFIPVGIVFPLILNHVFVSLTFCQVHHPVKLLLLLSRPGFNSSSLFKYRHNHYFLHVWRDYYKKVAFCVSMNVGIFGVRGNGTDIVFFDIFSWHYLLIALLLFILIFLSTWQVLQFPLHTHHHIVKYYGYK